MKQPIITGIGGLLMVAGVLLFIIPTTDDVSAGAALWMASLYGPALVIGGIFVAAGCIVSAIRENITKV